MSHWRAKSTQVIRAIIAAHPDADLATLRAAISAAYPFGERKYHPYKIWLDEVKRQLGTKVSAGPCICGHGKASHRSKGACFADGCKCPLFGTVDWRQEELKL